MTLSYVWASNRSRAESVPPYANSKKNLTLRQLFAHHVVHNVFAADRIIVKVDENLFNETTSRSFSFVRRGKITLRTYKYGIASLNLFLAVVEDGRCAGQDQHGDA